LEEPSLSYCEYQGAIYDVEILPKAQGKGVDKIIRQAILDRLPKCNLILYATLGKEVFCQRLGYKLMKTGMTVFTNAQTMAQKGFTE